MPHIHPELVAEIRNTVGHLPGYKYDPEKPRPLGWPIDYTGSLIAYAVSVNLFHGNLWRHPQGLYLPTRDTKVLVVTRAGGDGTIGTKSGVSGYVDKIDDKWLRDEVFDPLTNAAMTEPHEECGIPMDTMRTIDLRLGSIIRGGVDLAMGGPFVEFRHNAKGRIIIAPFGGICHGKKPPAIIPKQDEISAYDWIPLREIANHPDLSPGYLERTLPSALGALGLRPEAANELLLPV